MAKGDYDVDSIDVHEGPEGIRSNLSMYIGEHDYRGVVHLWKEIIGNSADEATNGYGGTIRSFFAKDGTITVGDEGRGIPVGPRAGDKLKRDTLTILCTVTHSSGKFSGAEANYGKGRIGCFVGSTRIKLLNGRTARIDAMAADFEATARKHWVYAYNKENGLAFTPRRAYGAFATRMASQLTEVVLSNGQKVYCTPDHPFMLWDGSYCPASKLTNGQSLRAVHFAYDKDGYLTHSGPLRLATRPVKNYLHRVQRTVALGMGWDIDGKDVAHKNANKTDNRPNNLVPKERNEHWWHDYHEHEKNKDWVTKNGAGRARSQRTMEKLNEQVEDLQTQAQLGRYAQVAARAYRDYGVVTEGTYNASLPWCGPKWDKAVTAMGSERAVLRAGKAYLQRYGNEGKTNNGGLGLSYKLQSEYEVSPAKNYANHSVVSVRTFKLKQPVQVYGLSVEQDHNYLLDAGVFVKNTHGVGLAVVNALSEQMEVWSWRNSTWNYQAFKRGVPVEAQPKKVRALPAYVGLDGQPNAGTVVRYKPILSCFAKGAGFNVRYAMEWLDDISWLIGDVQLITQIEGKRPTVIHRPNGLRDRFDHEVARLGVETQFEPFVYHSDRLDVMLGWTTGTGETVFSAVGSVKTAEGGTHVSGLFKAINDSFAEYAGKNSEYKPDYLRVGLIAVVNVRFGADKPRFNSQDKVKLVSEEGRSMVVEELFSAEPYALWAWLGERANKPLRDYVLEKAVEWTSFNADIKASKELKAAYKTTSKGKINLPENLAASTTDDPNERELFLVEGDSASGTAKKARDARFQEVLGLRGKLTNIYKTKDSEAAMFNKSIVDIGQSLGYDPENPGSYRVSKVIILADADDDGFHIGALILALFWRRLSPLVRAGRLFMCDSPLYQYTTPSGKIYGANLGEIHAAFKRSNPRGSLNPSEVTRMKGLGEANASVLYDVAFNLGTRKLRRVLPLTSEAEAIRLVEWMGNDAAPRAQKLLKEQISNSVAQLDRA